jgi:hypothetical protein
VPRTFRAAGTFRYVCEAHEDDGMIGTVTVSGTGSQGPPPGDSPGGGGPGGDPGGGPGQGQGPGADTTRPIVSRFGIAKARLRSGRRTSFRFRLSEPADVRIAISRSVKRRGRTRWVAKGAVVRRDAGQGPNSVSFAGRSRGKPLAAGRYRAAIVATDEAGNRSRPKRASFRILA